MKFRWTRVWSGGKKGFKEEKKKLKAWKMRRGRWQKNTMPWVLVEIARQLP